MFDLRIKSIQECKYRGVEANVIDCNIVVNEFELDPAFHFRTNTLWKKYELSYSQTKRSIVSILFLYKDGFGFK